MESRRGAGAKHFLGARFIPLPLSHLLKEVCGYKHGQDLLYARGELSRLVRC